MKKIGIVTLHGYYNYGNRLQNFAVKETLKKITNETVKVAEISEVNHYIFVKLCLFKKAINDMIRETKAYMFSGGKKDIAYLCDYKEENYRAIICGSDQIWNPTWAGNAFMFASFASKNKRIAYAASFGVSEIPEDKKAEYAKYLSEMKAISVREEAGAKIVKELTGRDAELLIDPTLMLDKKEWQGVSKKPRFNKDTKYIITYFLSSVEEKQKKYIENIASINECDIINLERYNPNKYWYLTGPAEFIWLIEHCEIMFTDSFHGSVFSILMDVPFIVFERNKKEANMGSRIDTLLKTLQLQDRRFNNQTPEQIMKKDYSHIPEILEQERNKAISFLKNAMEIE